MYRLRMLRRPTKKKKRLPKRVSVEDRFEALYTRSRERRWIIVMRPAFAKTLYLAAVCGAVVICSAVATQDIPVQPAARPAPSGDDEIVVYGSIPELRRQLVRTRDVMFARFNEVNGDDKFDLHCVSEPVTGSRILRERCVSNIWKELDAKIAQAYLGQLRGETGPPAGFYLGQQNYWNSRLREEWARVANEDAGFRETMKRFGQARDALDRLAPPILSTSEDITTNAGLFDGATRALDVSAGHKPWKHKLGTRTFAIATPGNGIQALTVTCENATEHLEYQSNSQWTIPDDYGACRVQVDATPGTAFNFYEFPDQ
jgi:hypothetical protein